MLRLENNSSYLHKDFYRKIHYLTREFRVDCTQKPISHESRSDECDIGFQAQFNMEFSSQVMNFPWIAELNKIRKKENSNNIVWFYPERALQKAIWKSTVKTVIALANKQGQGLSYTCTSCLLLHLFSNFLNKLRSNVEDK